MSKPYTRAIPSPTEKTLPISSTEACDIILLLLLLLFFYCCLKILGYLQKGGDIEQEIVWTRKTMQVQQQGVVGMKRLNMENMLEIVVALGE